MYYDYEIAGVSYVPLLTTSPSRPSSVVPVTISRTDAYLIFRVGRKVSTKQIASFIPFLSPPTRQLES